MNPMSNVEGTLDFGVVLDRSQCASGGSIWVYAYIFNKHREYKVIVISAKKWSFVNSNTATTGNATYIRC
jgi:hypothetical protein